ncbi:MAG: transglutaminase family protein [Candidatus Aenigmatarchaeota archaeon]
MKLFFVLFVILLSTPAFASITNPQMVDKLEAEVVEYGNIEVIGSVSSIQLNLSIPQEDAYQKIGKFEVSDSNGPCANSCSYKFTYDEFGNKILNIIWKNAVGNIDYTVKSAVSVSRRYSAEKRLLQDFLKPTDLVQSTDKEIADVASNARGSDFEKISYLSKWINENVKYNTVYSDINIPAKKILDLRFGVCKEFSNLLVSFLRSIGYYSAVTVGYVHPGTVYSGESFLPHGWVEVYSDGGILSDPTWSEVGYLDATHIKFATFPDSKWTFSSIYSTGFGSFKVNLKNSNVSINLLNYSESPVFAAKSSLLETNLWKGYAVLRTDIDSDRCLLTKFDIRSCNSDGADFLKKLAKDNVTYFCNKKSIFTIFEIPNIQRNMKYNCPITVLFYGSGQETIPLGLSYNEEGYTRLSVDKTTVSPNEKIEASADSSDIFTSNGDYEYDNAEFYSGYYDFEVYSYNKGALDQQKISVVLNKPLDAFIVSNDTAYSGEPLPIIVVVSNLLRNNQLVTVKFGGEVQSDYIVNSRNFSFNFTPKGKEDDLIQAVVNTSDFSTSLSRQITVVEKEDAVSTFTDFLSSIFKAVSDFLEWLFGQFK